VNALALGQWYEIPNTSISSVDPNPPGAHGVEGPTAKVDDWTSFVLDTRTSKFYSVAGGGHAGYGGNEVDALELEHENPFWVQVLAPTPAAQATGCSKYYADGRPTSRHQYYGAQLDAFSNRIMLFGGSWFCDNGTPLLPTIDSWNINGDYNPAGTHADMPTAFRFYDTNWTLDPNTGDVYAVFSRQIGRWNRSTNTFTADLGSSGPGALQHGASAFDTSRGRIFYLGGDNGNQHLYTLASNTFSTVTLTGPNVSNVQNLGDFGMSYIPALDAFFVRNRAAGGTIYRIDASTFQVTTFVTTGGASIPATLNGPFNKFSYVPRLRGAILVPTYSGNAWFLRIH
jgi:hypothetical protein